MQRKLLDLEGEAKKTSERVYQNDIKETRLSGSKIDSFKEDEGGRRSEKEFTCFVTVLTEDGGNLKYIKCPTM